MFIKIGSSTNIPPAGSGSDKIFYLNGQTVLSSYTIPENSNALTAGPVSVEGSVTVTIPSTSTWVVV